MGCIKHLIVLLSLGFLSARGQAPIYPKDSTAIVYVIPGSARSSEAYFNSGLIEKAQQIEAERSIESQHALYALSSNFFTAFPVYFMHQDDILLLQGGTRKGYFLDTLLSRDSSITCIEKYIILAEIGPVYGSQLADPYHDGKTSALTQTPQLQEALVLKDIDGNQLHDDVMPCYSAIRSINKKRHLDWSVQFEENGYRVNHLSFQYPSVYLLFARPDKIEQPALAVDRIKKGKLNECHPITKAVIRLNSNLIKYYKLFDE